MELFNGGLEETRFGLVGGFFLIIFLGAGILGGIYFLLSLAKNLANKETRPGAIKEVKESVEGVADAARFISTNKDFHREMKREFRPQIILLSVLGVMFLLMLIGVS